MVSKGKNLAVAGFSHFTLAPKEDAVSNVPANLDAPYAVAVWEKNPKVLEWLSRIAEPGLAFEVLGLSLSYKEKAAAERIGSPVHDDDWQVVANLCGYSAPEFASAGSALPLTVAEVEHFRRNHRNADYNVCRDFFATRADLPSPLSELYGLYLYRAHIDAESALFVAQTTGSTRVARTMADLLAIGAFANGIEYITYLGLTYSVPAAFDTSNVIDAANHEAMRRMALSAEHPSHLLRLTPDEIGVLAANIANRNALPPGDFLDKSNLLAEARQDVTRLPVSEHFSTAIAERDLPLQQAWVSRLCSAYMRVLENWATGLPAPAPVVH